MAVIAAAGAIIWVLVVVPRLHSVATARANVQGDRVTVVPGNLATRITEASKRVGHPRIALIEFSDFQCPYCGTFARDSFPQVAREFIDTGKVAFVFRHFPLNAQHPLAEQASEAAECGRRQGKFWELHDRLFRHQALFGATDFANDAAALRLNATLFTQCLHEKTFVAIAQDRDEGQRLGVNGTPTMFVGRIQADDTNVKLVARIAGAQPYAVIKGVIESALRQE